MGRRCCVAAEAALLEGCEMLPVRQRLWLRFVFHPPTEKPRHFAAAVGPEDVVGLSVGIAGGPGGEGGLPMRRAGVGVAVAAGGSAGRRAEGSRLGRSEGGEANGSGDRRQRGGSLG